MNTIYIITDNYSNISKYPIDLNFTSQNIVTLQDLIITNKLLSGDLV